MKGHALRRHVHHGKRHEKARALWHASVIHCCGMHALSTVVQLHVLCLSCMGFVCSYTGFVCSCMCFV